MDRKEMLDKAMKKVKSIFPSVTNASGIYAFVRHDGGFKFAYVGQAKHLLKRIAEHCIDYKQHIDRSIKTRKLATPDNPAGWQVFTYEYPVDRLNEEERKYIKLYADMGFQLYNKTIGGQDEGKAGLGEGKSNKGYRDGVEYGYKKALREVAVFFRKYLCFGVQEPVNKTKLKKLEQFQYLLGETNNE